MLNDATGVGGSYSPTADAAWSKYVPGDFGSPHWYDAESMTALVLSYAQGPNPPPIGQFIRSFTGLAGTPAAKAVTAAVPGISNIAELAANRAAIPVLLAAMKRRAKRPTTTSLGPVGETHLHAVVDQGYGVVGRYWYKRVAVDDGSGIPWLVEAFIAETSTAGRARYLMNHSPVEADPLSRSYIEAGDIYGHGVSGVLSNARIRSHHIAVVHIVCPAPTFTDRGKTTLDAPRSLKAAVGKALWSVSRTLHKEARQDERDAAAARRRQQRQLSQAAASEKWSMRDAVFNVMPQAFDQAGGGRLPVGCRALYYQVRPLIQAYTDAPLGYGYYGTLLAEYQQIHGELPGLYYDPRGSLDEPHHGRTVPLGTREVAGYTPPDWLYDKLLYVEKKGLRPVLNAAQLADRYDMAIMYGEGYATEAARVLAARVQRDHEFKVYLLHDGDVHGYNIAKTFAEETARMPDHHIEVVDIGLTVADAIERGLETERFERTAALPARLDLDEQELEWFTGEPIYGRRTPTWLGTRVELNALSSPDLVAFIEERLPKTKVVPPDDVLTARAALTQRAALDAKLDQLIADALDRDALLEALLAEFATVPPDDLTADVTALHERDRAKPWTRAIDDRVDSDYRTAADAIRERFTELLAEQIEANADDEAEAEES